MRVSRLHCCNLHTIIRNAGCVPSYIRRKSTIVSAQAKSALVSVCRRRQNCLTKIHPCLKRFVPSARQTIHCVLVDESQFLTRQQVYQLSEVVDKLDIPVLCYGLRTDFRGELFVGSQYLLAWSDKLVELKLSVSAVVKPVWFCALIRTAGLITKANRWLLAE